MVTDTSESYYTLFHIDLEQGIEVLQDTIAIYINWLRLIDSPSPVYKNSYSCGNRYTSESYYKLFHTY